MRVLLAGSTGLVGSELLKLLLADSDISSVYAVTRRALGIQHGKLSELDFHSEFPACDVAFSCLGTTIKKAGSQDAFRAIDHDLNLSFAAKAKAAGVKRFVCVSALGADPSSRVFYNRVKGETERDLEAMGFESLVLARPSLLLGERKEQRIAEGLAIQLTGRLGFLFRGPLLAWAPIDASSVAHALLRAAKAPYPGRVLVLSNEMMLSASPDARG